MKWILRISVALLALLAGLFWWFMLSGSDATSSASELFPIEDWRAEFAGDDVALRPTELRLIEVGYDVAPGFAAQAGMFGRDWKTTYGGFQIVTPTGSIFVDGGIDAETAELMTQSVEESAFNLNQYEAVLNAFESAEHIVLTHEHLDHVMAIARHPNPGAIAGSLRLNSPQKAALGRFSKAGSLPPELDAVAPSLREGMQKLAPGVLIASSAGHTAGSQVIFVTLQDGSEYLLIGDIVWTMSNIADLKTRPRLTQVIVFDPNENRSAIREQVRALHELVAAEPLLTILPAHYRDYLMGLVNSGSIGLGLQ
ncbi:MAG: MBL fold metallo-hydrolase [Pseudomonadota bacterium]